MSTFFLCMYTLISIEIAKYSLWYVDAKVEGFSRCYRFK